eukprot:306140-Chlamydomonas_euryale.AAC.1
MVVCWLHGGGGRGHSLPFFLRVATEGDVRGVVGSMNPVLAVGGGSGRGRKGTLAVWQGARTMCQLQ